MMLVVKNPAANAGDMREDLLEDGMTVHASSLAWGSLWAQEPGTDHRVVNSQA